MIGAASGLYNFWLLFFVWPLAIVSAFTLMLSVTFVEAERDEWGSVTRLGRHATRSRILLMSNCITYFLIIILVHVLIGSWNISIVLWERHFALFLSLMIGADVFAALSAVESYWARGNRILLIQIATPIILVASTIATFSIPLGH